MQRILGFWIPFFIILKHFSRIPDPLTPRILMILDF